MANLDSRSRPALSATHVRPARRGDRERLLELLVAQLREHRIRTPRARLARAVDGVLGDPQRGRLLVATIGGRPIGLAALSFVWPLEHGGRSAWLEELYVEPSHRGRGIGRTLLRAACRVAARAGAAAVDLEVDAAHRRAGRLYARAGLPPLPPRRS